MYGLKPVPFPGLMGYFQRPFGTGLATAVAKPASVKGQNLLRVSPLRMRITDTLGMIDYHIKLLFRGLR